MKQTQALTQPQLLQLRDEIKTMGQALGFQELAVTDCDLGDHPQHVANWLEQGFHGTMAYMERNNDKRANPAALEPGTLRVISARIDYLPEQTPITETLEDSSKAYIARYALGRDYHKMLRKRLATLAKQISEKIGPFGFRAFVDSAPVLEKALAEKAGIGWIGKHTLLLNRHAGSWFFLGELFVDIPLPVDEPTSAHCGKCQSCIDICPTQAIVAPYQLDARKCIAYLTIEHHGAIPQELRAPMGNRVFGCDDCQIACPWNRFASASQEQDFSPRHNLDIQPLDELFLWDEATFLKNTEGSPIRRIGYERWLRNLAVGLGNAPSSTKVIKALEHHAQHDSEMVREHVTWALNQHRR